MPRKLTQKAVREYLRLLGATLHAPRGMGGYSLRYRERPGSPDGIAEYFEADLAGVVETARVMLGGHERFRDAEERLQAELGMVRA